mgnify:CR=1 FL=1
MESKVKEAVQRKMCGYNCAQAVACTYCEQAGLDEETVKNLTQGFAVGMGGSMEATCGAIIGAVNVLGMINKNPQKTMQSASSADSKNKMVPLSVKNSKVLQMGLSGENALTV